MLLPYKQNSDKAEKTEREKIADKLYSKFGMKFSIGDSYLLDERMSNTKIPGKILEVYRDQASLACVPFFLVEYNKTCLICTIDPRR